MTTKEKQTKQAKLEQLLKEHGFTFEIGGCGCCGSPWVKAAWHGEVIFNDSNVNMDMFAKETK